jgi:hypothetical protein
MWIRVGGLDCFVKTVDEGDFTWEFDGEVYTIHKGREISPIARNERYSIIMLTVQKTMPLLYQARLDWQERKHVDND